MKTNSKLRYISFGPVDQNPTPKMFWRNYKALRTGGNGVFYSVNVGFALMKQRQVVLTPSDIYPTPGDYTVTVNNWRHE